MSEHPRGPDAADDLHDRELARRYREAAREEPPRDLDDAILAAARREAGTRPHALENPQAPAPGRSRRVRQLPLALAAVIVLSVSIVALNPEVQRSKPDEQQAEPPPSLADAPSPQRAPSPAAPEPPRPAAERDASRSAAQAPRRQETFRYQHDPRSRAAAEADETPDRAAHADRLEARKAERARSAEAQVGAAAPPAALARQRVDEPPEKWGERIVELRRQGRAAEADALLAEFRARFPHYGVPPEWTR